MESYICTTSLFVEHASDFFVGIGVDLLGWIEKIVFGFCFNFGLHC